MSDALRRYLAQQIELGGRDVFLDTAEAGTLRALLAGGLSLPVAAPPPTAPHRDASAPSVATPRTAPSSTASARGAGSPAHATPPAGDAYEALREEALGCTRCRLAEGRTQVVFSDGVPDARLVVVGEAPGANEDATGLPFVGAAGQLLDLLLAAVGLSRTESVYICNVLKCRPPGNRNPLPDEIEACSSYLKRQLALVQPEALLAVGTFSAQLLTGTSDPIGKLRGTVHTYEGTPLVVTYHPAALLRNQGWTRLTWDDLQLLRDVMDASA
ncbi:MAG: uracil-DNA glycosylase [Gemmatimonadota bacterium]|nr:uracil-DNA glycosylase [Gemmatimonadota bacterium]